MNGVIPMYYTPEIQIRITLEYELAILLRQKGFSEIQIKQLTLFCNQDLSILPHTYIILPIMNNNPLLDCKEYITLVNLMSDNDELYKEIANKLCDKICKHFNIQDSKPKKISNKVYVTNNQPMLCTCCGAPLQPPFNHCDFCGVNFIEKEVI